MTREEQWLKESIENYIFAYTGKRAKISDADAQHFTACAKSYLNLFTPSLPSNLDEAAEKLYPYKEGYDVELPYPSTFDENKYERDAFKAGAEWRDAQIPKLPENLDEAADNHAANNGGRWLTDDIGIKCFAFNPQEVKDAFKAGAEWMAGQFVLVGGEPTGWFMANDGSEYATGLDLKDPIKLPVDFYVRKK